MRDLPPRAVSGVLALFCAVSVVLAAVQTWRLHSIQHTQAATVASAVATAVREAEAAQAVKTAIPFEPLPPVQANTEALEAESHEDLDEAEGDIDSAPVNTKEVTLARAKLERALARSVAKAERTMTKDAKGNKGANHDSYASPEVAAKAAQMVKNAQKAINQGNYDDAVAMLQDSLATDPTQRNAYKTLASLYHTMGLSEQEAQVYADWSANRPQDAMPHYQQASLLASMGLSGDALAELQQFESLTRGDARSYSMTASMYRRLGLTQDEGAVLQQWVQQTPGSVDALRNMAQYYTRTGDRASALATYSTIAEMVPGNATAHTDLAQAYLRTRQYAQAQAEYVAAMNLQPQNLDVRLALASSYRQGGDRASALQTYAAIVTDAPGSAQAVQAQRAIAILQRTRSKH